MMFALFLRKKQRRPDPVRVFRRFLRLIGRSLPAPQRGSAPFAGSANREKA